MNQQLRSMTQLKKDKPPKLTQYETHNLNSPITII